MKIVLSLGGGVQSTTLLVMAIKGLLPKPDAAIFADTGWEPKAVYEHIERLKSVAEGRGITFITCGKPTIREDTLRSTLPSGQRAASLPFYTKDQSGKVGMIRRQCTEEYKLAPIRKAIREQVLMVKTPPRSHSVDQWIGISTDEASRMRDSDVKYVRNVYPLIEMQFNRSQCIKWLSENGFPAVPKSACIGCPFHTDGQWVQIRHNKTEWDDACEFDEAIRKKNGHRGELYLHRSGSPLRDTNLDHADEATHLWNQECTGMCGV